MGDHAELLDRLLAEPDQGVVEEDRLDRPDALPLDLDRLLGREARTRALGLREHGRESLRTEVALVEELLGRLNDGGDDPGSAHDATGRANGATAHAPCDLPDLERELGRACERVASLVHR